MKKTIWIINQYAGSKIHGMNYRSYYFGKLLAEKGYGVKLFSGSYSHLYNVLPVVNKKFTNEKIDGIEYIWVKVPKYKLSKSFGRLLNMAVFTLRLFTYKYRKLEKPDVILVSSLSPFPVIVAYLWAKKMKSRLVFEVRDLWPLTLIEVGNKSKFHPVVMIFQVFEWFAYRYSDIVVSLLPNAFEHMQTKGLPFNKFRYIPNGIDLSELDNPKNISTTNKFKKIPENSFIVGYAGTIGIANALEELLCAAKNLKKYSDIHFVIVGNGGNKDSLIDYVERHVLNNVTFIDAIPKAEISELLKRFDICTIGGHESSMYRFGISPNKLFDYMIAAKPVLLYLKAGNNPVENSGCGIIVEDCDAHEITASIVCLYNMPVAELKKMGELGKIYVQDNHTYQALVEQYEDFFNIY